MFQKQRFPVCRSVVERSSRRAWWLGALLAWWVYGSVPALAGEGPIRLGWIDRFASGSLSGAPFNALQSHLVGYDPLGCPEQRVVLQRVPPTDISLDQRTIRGACGADVRIPEGFEMSSQTHFYRGVIFDERRPGSQSRQAWLQESRDWAEDDGSPLVPLPVLSPELLPSDVVVCIGGDGHWQIGCDFNVNLNLEPSECFKISAALGQPIIALAAGTAVVMRGEMVSSETEPDSAEPKLQILCVDQSREKRRSSSTGQAMIASLAVELSRDEERQVEWVLLPTGRGAADVAAAMTAAQREGCDAVVVNLDGLLHRPTDAARLIAELSRRSKIPVMATRRTPISPDFFVEPARRSVPDLAEIHFRGTKPDTTAFEDAVGKLISDRASYRRATQADALTGLPTQPAHYLRPIAGEISSERFIQIAGREISAARVPRDAVNGRVDMVHRQVKLDDIDAAIYDEKGMRVAITRHGDDAAFDRIPPAQILHARGGFVLSDRFLTWNGSRHDTLGKDVSLHWTRPRDVAEVMGASLDNIPVTESKMSDESITRDGYVEPRYQIDRLRRVETAQVPDRIEQMTAGLTRRGPDVVSWWYREPPRHGSITPRHLFQDEFSQPVTWSTDRLQFWMVYENGRLRPGYHSIGDPCGVEPADAWILVQAARTGDIVDADPPRLIQSSTLPVCQPRSLPWRWIPPAVLHREPAAQEPQAVPARERAMLAAEDHFLLGEFRAEGEEAFGYRWWWAGTSPPASEQGPWLEFYDNDVVQAAVDERKSQGQSAAQIVAKTPRPDDDSSDLVAWRKYLVAIDQSEVRKSHLDLVEETARQVLKRCRQRMGGLPEPQPPYLDGAPATGGRTALPTTRPPSDFEFRLDSDFLHTYAWAVDAAYRLTRAIGYRELPDVVAEHPIVDPAAQDRAYEEALFQLCGLVKITDPRFFLTLRRYHHSRDEPIQAYQVLTRYGYEGPATPWYFKKERDAFEQSGVRSLSRLGYARWFLHENGDPIRQAWP